MKLPFTEPRYDRINPAVHVEGNTVERVIVKCQHYDNLPLLSVDLL